MSSLVPCSGCRRHLRRTETVCPFCAAPVALALELAPERSVPASGVKRAALFAMGLSAVASACEADSSVPIYGAPVAPEAVHRVGTAGPSEAPDASSPDASPLGAPDAGVDSGVDAGSSGAGGATK